MIDSIPYIILAVFGAALIAVSFRFFGMKAAGLVTALLAIIATYLIGRREGRTDQSKEAAQDAVEIRNKASAIRTGSAIRNADPDELLKDDGYRRD